MKRLAWFPVLLLSFLPRAQGQSLTAIPGTDVLVFAAQADIRSLDPAAANDDASWSVLAVLYDRLIDYDGASLDRFVPKLAVEVPSSANGGISRDGLIYTFKIRSGVKFHNGYPLSADDVAYSFRRNMVTDPEGGPGWIWYRTLLSRAGSRGEDGRIAVSFSDIEAAVKASADTVVFRLARPFPGFLSVLAGRSASVVSRKWVTERGGWDGTAKGWERHNGPAPGKETLAAAENGTGPYRLIRWTKGQELAVERVDGAWGPKPALRSGIFRVVDDAAARKRMLLSGEADLVALDPADIEVPDAASAAVPDTADAASLEGAQGVTVLKALPVLRLDGMHWNLAIEANDNSWIGSGKLDGQGIPPGFFGDADVRHGFQYAWDGKAYLKDAFPGGMETAVPVPMGLSYRNDGLKSAALDLKKAAESLKKAFSGQVWEKGFRVDLPYDAGNAAREAALKMLARNLNSLNPRFQVGVQAVEWIRFQDLKKNRRLPVYFLSWAADYGDIDDFLHPYMHSQGAFAARQGYLNAEADKLVLDASAEMDASKRKAACFKLQEIWVQDAIAVLLGQAAAVRAVRDRVEGYEYHPMEGGPFARLPSMRKR